MSFTVSRRGKRTSPLLAGGRHWQALQQNCLKSCRRRSSSNGQALSIVPASRRRQAAVCGRLPMPAAAGSSGRLRLGAVGRGPWRQQRSASAAACFQLQPSRRRIAASPVVEEAPASPVVPCDSPPAAGSRQRLAADLPPSAAAVGCLCCRGRLQALAAVGGRRRRRSAPTRQPAAATVRQCQLPAAATLRR